MSLVLLLQRNDTVISLALLVVQLVLLSVDDDHRMPNSPCQLVRRRTL